MRNTLLLVEDNPTDAVLAQRVLARCRLHAQVLHLQDGRDALDFLLSAGAFAERDRSPVALVLLDLKLPRVDGLTILERMRADPRTRAIPVIILTVSREQQEFYGSQNLGADAFIHKPLDQLQFCQAVRTIGLDWLLAPAGDGAPDPFPRVPEPPPAKR